MGSNMIFINGAQADSDDIITMIEEYVQRDHSDRVRCYTAILAQTYLQLDKDCGLDDEKIAIACKASALHDVGKLMIPREIVDKPGPLTDEEMRCMRQHATIGCQMLEAARNCWDEGLYPVCLDVVGMHHERWDGGGYPNQLTGEQIPLVAQLAAMADVYDALRHQRVYKEAFDAQRTYDTIMAGKCGAFSARMYECFDLAFPQLEEITTRETASAE